jgi:hypothetical protein
MEFRDTGCCGIQEITQLSNYSSAEEAMLAFCKELFKVDENSPSCRFGRSVGVKGTIYTHYLFTAAVYGKKTRDSYEADMRCYQPYGAEFAQYIKDFNLGTVVGSEAEINHAFHPDHSVQAWIWTANSTNLQAWYKQNKYIVPFNSAKLALEKAEAKLKKIKATDYYYRSYLSNVEAARINLEACKATLEKVNNESIKTEERPNL